MIALDFFLIKYGYLLNLFHTHKAIFKQKKTKKNNNNNIANEPIPSVIKQVPIRE